MSKYDKSNLELIDHLIRVDQDTLPHIEVEVSKKLLLKILTQDEEKRMALHLKTCGACAYKHLVFLRQAVDECKELIANKIVIQSIITNYLTENFQLNKKQKQELRTFLEDIYANKKKMKYSDFDFGFAYEVSQGNAKDTLIRLARAYSNLLKKTKKVKNLEDFEYIMKKIFKKENLNDKEFTDNYNKLLINSVSKIMSYDW